MSSQNLARDLTSLICSILFITIELLLRDSHRARCLLRNELDMLGQWNTTSTKIPATPTEKTIISRYIEPMLIRFWLQADPLQDTSTKNSLIVLDREVARPAALIEGENFIAFRCLDEAKEGLQSILESTFSGLHTYTSRGDTDKVHKMHTTGTSLLSTWKARFSMLCIEVGATPAEKSTVLLLEIQSQVAELTLRTLVSTQELPLAVEFSRQIDLCERFLKFHAHHNQTRDRVAGFFMDHAIIPALYFHRYLL